MTEKMHVPHGPWEERDFSPAGLCNLDSSQRKGLRGTMLKTWRQREGSIFGDRKNFTLLVLGVCGGRWQEGLAEKEKRRPQQRAGTFIRPVKESGCIQRSGEATEKMKQIEPSGLITESCQL